MSDSNGWPALAALDAASLPERIATLLREAILDGRLPRGGQVVESRLARQLGVGQNAVREALYKLQFEGFVNRVPNLGTFVATLSRRDVDDVFRLRIELEALAVYWAREKGRPDASDFERLSQHLEDAARAAHAGDLTAYVRADIELHRCLWEMAGNQSLAKCLELIAVPQLSCRLLESQGTLQLNLEALAATHRQWLEAIRAKPPRVAYIHTRNILSVFWGEVESAMNNNGPAAEMSAEPVYTLAAALDDAS